MKKSMTGNKMAGKKAAAAVKKLTGLCLAAALGSMMLAGCGGKAESGAAQTEAAQAGSETAGEAQENQAAQGGQTAENSAAQENQASGETLKVAIIQHMDHPSLNQINAKIQETLQPLVDEGKVEIVEKNASGDQTMLPTILNSLVQDGCDILVPIATPTAQAAAAATKEIPIVFSAVSNPVEAGLVTAFDATDGNITGVSNSIAIEDIFKLAAELTPDAKTFGFVYNTSEINSVTGIERAKKYCDENGLSYKEATITGTADVQQAAASLVGQVDAFFTPNDNTVASAMAAYLQVANEAGLPVYCGADSMVNDGGFATVGIDYDVLGVQTGEMVKRIVEGAAISDTPVEQIAEYAKMINVKTAAGLGIEIPEDKKEEFQMLGE